MLVHKYFDLLPLNLVYFVLENGNLLENLISLAVGTMMREYPDDTLMYLSIEKLSGYLFI